MVNDLLLILPEEILTLGALVLMMLAAWLGDRSAPLLTWLGVATLALGSLLPGVRDPAAASLPFCRRQLAAFAKIVFAGPRSLC